MDTISGVRGLQYPEKNKLFFHSQKWKKRVQRASMIYLVLRENSLREVAVFLAFSSTVKVSWAPNVLAVSYYHLVE